MGLMVVSLVMHLISYIMNQKQIICISNHIISSHIIKCTIAAIGIFLGYLQNASIVLAFDLDWPLVVSLNK